MAANRKLTGVIKGRTVKDISTGQNALSLSFDDGSVARIKTGDQPSPPSSAEDSGSGVKGKTIKSVQQKGSTLTLTFEDNTSTDINLAEATSSVMVRDKAGSMEYAD